jgi:hypothetical protein
MPNKSEKERSDRIAREDVQFAEEIVPACKGYLKIA